MMRKIVALLLATAMLLSVTACGKKKSGNLENTNAEDTAPEPPSGETAEPHLNNDSGDLNRRDLNDEQFRDIVEQSEIAEDISVLDLSFNQITDLSPVANFKDIRTLFASGGEGDNQFSDLTPLAGLTSLEFLQLSINPITDLSPLAGLKNLQALHLSWCEELSDITPLAKLDSLRDLRLRKTAVTDISPLSELTNLTLLDVSETDIDISVLQELKTLATLEIRGMGLDEDDVEGIISELPNLEVLDIANNSITDLSFLKEFGNLKQITLSGNDISMEDVEALREALPDCEITFKEPDDAQAEEAEEGEAE